MIRKTVESVLIGIITSFILKGLEKYGGIPTMRSIFQSFIIELWPIWFGLLIAILYFLIRLLISDHKIVVGYKGFRINTYPGDKEELSLEIQELSKKTNHLDVIKIYLRDYMRRLLIFQGVVEKDVEGLIKEFDEKFK